MIFYRGNFYHVLAIKWQNGRLNHKWVQGDEGTQVEKPFFKTKLSVSWIDIKCMKRTTPKSWAKYTTCTYQAAPKSWLKYSTVIFLLRVVTYTYRITSIPVNNTYNISEYIENLWYYNMWVFSKINLAYSPPPPPPSR